MNYNPIYIPPIYVGLARHFLSLMGLLFLSLVHQRRITMITGTTSMTPIRTPSTIIIVADNPPFWLSGADSSLLETSGVGLVLSLGGGAVCVGEGRTG